MSKSELELEMEISQLKKELDELKTNKKISEIQANEDKYLGRYFKNGDKYVRPLSVLTSECPYQIYCIIVDLAYRWSVDKYGRNEWAVDIDYDPFYITKVFYKDFNEYEEISREEFIRGVEAQFATLIGDLADVKVDLDNCKDFKKRVLKIQPSEETKKIMEAVRRKLNENK